MRIIGTTSSVVDSSGTAMSDLLPYLRLLMRYRGRLGLGALLMLATAASGIGLLALSGWFITATATTGVLLAAGFIITFDIYVPGGGIRAFAVTRTVSRYFERVINHDTVLRLLKDLRGRTFRAIANLPPAAAARLRNGELLNRLTTDIDRLDGLFLRGIAPPLVAVLAILLTMTLMLIASVALSVTVGLLLLALAGGTFWWGWSKGQASTTALAESSAQLRAGAIDHLEGLADLQAFGSLDHHRERLLRLERQDHALNTQNNIRIAASESLLTVGVQLCMFGALLFGLYLYGTGIISGAVAVMLPLVLMALMEPLGVLPGAGWHLARARASALRLQRDMGEQGGGEQEDSHLQTQQEPGSLTPISNQAQGPEIQFKSIELTRGAGAHVLVDLSLTVQPGECLGILGASGSGKSSLVALLTAHLKADNGSISLNGEDITQIPRERLYQIMACLTQQTDLFSTTVANNLRIANPRTSTDELWRALEAVDLAEFVDQCPQGLNTWVGESGTRLSRGQARRLALARLFLRNPSVVVLDEPFSGLDAETADWVANRFTQWRKGRTTLIFGHDHMALPDADRWFTLRKGLLEPYRS